MDQEKRVLQWGGLAGVLGGILFILTIVILLAVVPTAPPNPAGGLARP